jgi:acetyl/propionyl-CoA carboxylase alpha subunit
MKTWRVGSETHQADLRLENGRLVGTLDGAPIDAAVARTGAHEIVLHVGGRRLVATVARRGSGWLVALDGRVWEVAAGDAGRGGGEADAGGAAEPFAVSPMTGVVAQVHVKPGDRVAARAPLFAIEAMKMEYVVRADRPVAIAEVRKARGDRVQSDEVVVTFAEA